MNTPVYSIKCPKCTSKAVARMHPCGNTGSYREGFIKFGVRRIVCGACGFSKDVPPAESDDYELWYATEFKGHRLWARNRSHLDFLTLWISGKRSKTTVDRSAVEAFPKWMILAKNRTGVLKCLSDLSNKDVNSTVQRTRANSSVHRKKRGLSVTSRR